jgi:hypothetical protein
MGTTRLGTVHRRMPGPRQGMDDLGREVLVALPKCLPNSVNQLTHGD